MANATCVFNWKKKMNLNKIYKLFRRPETLTRKDIETYRTAKDEHVRRAIEEKALSSDFDTDTLEGWNESKSGVSSMKKLDRHFLPRSTGVYWMLGGVISLLIPVFLFIFMKNDDAPRENGDTNRIQRTLLYEKTDLLIPEHLDELEAILQKDQIQLSSIKANNVLRQKMNPIRSMEPKSEVDVLPLKKLETKNTSTELASKQLLTKEVYLEGLKLIDYSLYRSRSSITTRQLDLTGISAEKETVQSSNEPVWREIEIPYFNYIQKSMVFFVQGNYKRALSRYEEILKTYPDDINALFYGGLCYYNLGQFNQAITFFETCQQESFTNFDEEARWYLGLSYEQDGNMEQARILYHAIVKEEGFYAKGARKKLNDH
jgi:TolA-binding protein